MENIDLDARRRERPSEITITLGGIAFRARTTVRPEATLAYDDFFENEDTSQARQLKVADETILAFLLPEFHDDWRKLRARVDDPIGGTDIIAFLEALQGAAADRPTVPSGDSSGTTVNGGQSSTVASSSPEATPTG